MVTDILNIFSRSYFWDVDPVQLDISKSRQLIIERVFSFGNINDLRQLMKIYSKKDIKESLCNLTYLDPKTLNFASLFLGIPKSRFKCYTKKQSNPTHWNY